jgi:hypothetical protein
MFSSSQVIKPFPDPLIKHVEQDVYEFVEQELVIYKRNPDNKCLAESVIVNLALFNLEALNYQNGYDQMENLLADHHNQVVSLRMKQLLHTLYIRYGIDTIDNLAEDVLKTMVHVYNIKGDIIKQLDSEYNVFWLQPFIRQAYDSMVNSVSDKSEAVAE